MWSQTQQTNDSKIKNKSKTNNRKTSKKMHKLMFKSNSNYSNLTNNNKNEKLTRGTTKLL